jgi:hypothetical protein
MSSNFINFTYTVIIYLPQEANKSNELSLVQNLSPSQ